MVCRKSEFCFIQRNCILENIRQEIYAKKSESGLLCTDSSEYKFCSPLAAGNWASTLRLFWLQSQLLNVADKPDVYIFLYYYKFSDAYDREVQVSNL